MGIPVAEGSIVIKKLSEDNIQILAEIKTFKIGSILYSIRNNYKTTFSLLDSKMLNFEKSIIQKDLKQTLCIQYDTANSLANYSGIGIRKTFQNANNIFTFLYILCHNLDQFNEGKKITLDTEGCFPQLLIKKKSYEKISTKEKEISTERIDIKLNKDENCEAIFKRTDMLTYHLVDKEAEWSFWFEIGSIQRNEISLYKASYKISPFSINMILIENDNPNGD